MRIFVVGRKFIFPLIKRKRDRVFLIACIIMESSVLGGSKPFLSSKTATLDFSSPQAAKILSFTIHVRSSRRYGRI